MGVSIGLFRRSGAIAAGLILLLVVGWLAAAVSARAASGEACTVADPSGTPLNVRVSPRGEIIATLDNGVLVMPTSQRMVQGRLWLKVEIPGGRLGWVFAGNLDCPAKSPTGNDTQPSRSSVRLPLPERCVVADPTGSALNVRVSPRGKIVATLDNGVAVMPVSQRTVQGTLWMKIEIPGGALGWAFASYLSCETPKVQTGNDPVHITSGSQTQPDARPHIGSNTDTHKSAPMKPRPSAAN